MCSALELNGQSGARRIRTDLSQGTAGTDQDSSKQNISQNRSKYRADQTHDMEEERHSKRDQDRQRQNQGGARQHNAKEGYDTD